MIKAEQDAAMAASQAAAGPKDEGMQDKDIPDFELDEKPTGYQTPE